MPTNNKTNKLGLNAWAATDKPKRADFVSDNQTIDSVLGGHLENTDMHLSAAQRAKIAAPFVIGAFGGDGAAEGVIVLEFSPSLVIFAQQSSAPAKQSGSETVVGMGFATPSHSSGGIRLSGTRIYVTQTQGTPSNGIRYNLNAASAQYMYIAFK